MMKRALIGLRASHRRRPLLGPSLLMVLLMAFDVVPFTNAFIVPEELPSILSLVYSNIPQIKKGTDSRIGFGFRLGEHADFQVQLELGPQLNTRPIGMAASSSKRYVDNEEYANSIRGPTRNGASTSWLQAWSKQTKQRQQFNKDKLRDSLMPPAPIMDEGAYNQLQQLYEMNKQREYENTIGTLPAELLEQRINQLKALHSPMASFKPLPVDPRASATESKPRAQEPSAPVQPSEPAVSSSMNIIVVSSEVPSSTSDSGTVLPTKPLIVEKERPATKDGVAGTAVPTVDGGRRNVRRRTNRPVSKRDKERITAQLSDVSLE